MTTITALISLAIISLILYLIFEAIIITKEVQGEIRKENYKTAINRGWFAVIRCVRRAGTWRHLGLCRCRKAIDEYGIAVCRWCQHLLFGCDKSEK